MKGLKSWCYLISNAALLLVVLEAWIFNNGLLLETKVFISVAFVIGLAGLSKEVEP